MDYYPLRLKPTTPYYLCTFKLMQASTTPTRSSQCKRLIHLHAQVSASAYYTNKHKIGQATTTSSSKPLAGWMCPPKFPSWK